MHVRVRVHVQGHCTTCCGGERICCRSLPHIETAVVVWEREREAVTANWGNMQKT